MLSPDSSIINENVIQTLTQISKMLNPLLFFLFPPLFFF